MISITLTESRESYTVRATGHSGIQGESVVCAGVSALIETWRLTEQILEQHTISYTNDLVEATIPKTTVSEILFIQLRIGLTAIQQQYPKEITLNIGG